VVGTKEEDGEDKDEDEDEDEELPLLEVLPRLRKHVSAF
jgi:hypothetical protein